MCKKVKHCKLCSSCRFDCMSFIPIEKCDNFKKGFTPKQYRKLIREQNLDIKSICDRYGVSRNIMFNMLNERQEFTYKYRAVLEDNIFEKKEYEYYIDNLERVANG